MKKMMSDYIHSPLWLIYSSKDFPDLMSSLDFAARNGIPPQQPFLSFKLLYLSPVLLSKHS